MPFRFPDKTEGPMPPFYHEKQQWLGKPEGEIFRLGSCDCFSLVPSQTPRYESASEVFEATIRSFRDSLPQGGQEAFQEFQSPQAMTEHIKDHCARFQKERKFSLFCNRLHEFAKAWEPFFDIVNIFVQASPEWAGVAWGAIRMVFLVGHPLLGRN